MNNLAILWSLLFSFYSAVCDFRYRKITNKSIVLAGTVSLFILFVKDGFLKGAAQIAVLIPVWILLFFLFVFKVTGAADIKLLYIISLQTGRDGIILVFIFSLFAGAFIGIIYLLRGEKTIPFAVAIFIGMVVYFYGKINGYL